MFCVGASGPSRTITVGTLRKLLGIEVEDDPPPAAPTNVISLPERPPASPSRITLPETPPEPPARIDRTHRPAASSRRTTRKRRPTASPVGIVQADRPSEPHCWWVANGDAIILVGGDAGVTSADKFAEMHASELLDSIRRRLAQDDIKKAFPKARWLDKQVLEHHYSKLVGERGWESLGWRAISLALTRMKIVKTERKVRVVENGTSRTRWVTLFRIPLPEH
jgi:hypothetical protein